MLKPQQMGMRIIVRCNRDSGRTDIWLPKSSVIKHWGVYNVWQRERRRGKSIYTWQIRYHFYELDLIQVAGMELPFTANNLTSRIWSDLILRWDEPVYEDDNKHLPWNDCRPAPTKMLTTSRIWSCRALAVMDGLAGWVNKTQIPLFIQQAELDGYTIIGQVLAFDIESSHPSAGSTNVSALIWFRTCAVLYTDWWYWVFSEWGAKITSCHLLI